MKEIEVKILEVNVQEVTQRLLSLGFEQVYSGELDSWYYDSADGAFQDSGRRLRLRKKGDKGLFTLKWNREKKDFKVADERQVHVDDVQTMKQIIEGLGFVEKRYRKKHRVSYQFGSIFVELDTLPGIPTYLEIEAPTEIEVAKTVRALGFNMEQTNSWNQNDVEKYYGGR